MEFKILKFDNDIIPSNDTNEGEDNGIMIKLYNGNKFLISKLKKEENRCVVIAVNTKNGSLKSWLFCNKTEEETLNELLCKIPKDKIVNIHRCENLDIF